MELRWLDAPADEVAAAMATLRRDSRPQWVPTRRQVLVHVNHCLILWYLCIVLMFYGIRVDVHQWGVVSGANIRDLLIALVILMAWLYGTFWLYRWAAKPPSPRARLGDWRQILTALTNGFEPLPSQSATFSSMITAGNRGAREYPRFVAQGVEFGNLTHRARGSQQWHYLTITLPAPLPHLILDSTANNGIRSDLPSGIDRGQRLSLEGNFDRWFHVYAPVKYRLEAHYFFTPDVMAALIDTASDFNVEIIDNTLVFFTPKPADFTEPDTWRTIFAIFDEAAVRIVASARRYRDERVPGQETAPLITKIEAELENPKIPWVAPPARIGVDGRRLTLRDRTRTVSSVLGAIGWFTLLTFLYVVPGIFAFAGFMSIVDGW